MVSLSPDTAAEVEMVDGKVYDSGVPNQMASSMEVYLDSVLLELLKMCLAMVKHY